MDKVHNTEEQWRAELSPERYAVLREKATERPFSSEYETLVQDGTYRCAGCGAELFTSEQKFDAHCGWPSFYDAKPGSVKIDTDESHGMVRTEVTCAVCGGHLGHMFEGEGFATPTDQRYCVNGLSLQFAPTK